MCKKLPIARKLAKMKNSSTYVLRVQPLLPLLCVTLLNTARLRALNVVLEILLMLLQFPLYRGDFLQSRIKVDAFLLPHQGLADSVGYAALVQSLVRSDRHLRIISYSQQKQPRLCAVDGYWNDSFIYDTSVINIWTLVITSCYLHK